MVQGGGKKHSVSRPMAVKKARSAKVTKQEKKKLQTKLGNPTQIPKKGKFRDDALDDRLLSKAIDKKSEQKVAAQVLQDGLRLATKDILQKGKDLNRELKRQQLKKKVGRVKEKLRELEAKAAEQG